MAAQKSPHARARRDLDAPMRSPVNWAMLGLMIERPSYAYDLAQRFEHRYSTVLSLSNTGHAYTAIGALRDRGLAAEIPHSRDGRQPRPRYRASPKGVRAYREWLVSQAGEERRQDQLLVLGLGALAGKPEDMLEVIERCEQEWLKEGMRSSIAREGSSRAEDARALLERLVGEKTRLAIGAKLAWVEYAREELGRRGS